MPGETRSSATVAHDADDVGFSVDDVQCIDISV